MTNLLITRHGESEHNLTTHVYMGRAPTSRLTEKGRDQAERLGRRLAQSHRLDHIVCSSLPRTQETAQAIAQSYAQQVLTAPNGQASQDQSPMLPPIYPEDAFWELSKGDWEGRMPRNLPPDIRQQLDRDPFGFRYPGGESYGDVWERIAPAFDGWLTRLGEGTVLFVLHGDVMRALWYHLIRFPKEKIEDFDTEPCALNQFRWHNGRTVVVKLNDTSHLV